MQPDHVKITESKKYILIAQPSPCHLCCDICEGCCTCDDCTSSSSVSAAASEIESEPMDGLTAQFLPIPMHQQKKQLHQKMVEYRSSKCPPHSTASLLIGSELLTGLSDKLIKDVFGRCMEIKDSSM